jgi:hypothetical protein
MNPVFDTTAAATLATGKIVNRYGTRKIFCV